MTKAEWLEKNGMDKDGAFWCITGNTYSIKNELKERGCRYSPLLKWYTPLPLDLPEGYKLVPFTFDEIYEWDEQYNEPYLLSSAKVTVEKRIAEAEGPSLSEYWGEVGKRYYNFSATYDSTRGFMGMYGYTFIHTFYSGNDCLVWFTSCPLELEEGQVVNITGTVKNHELFRNTKTTQLSRCTVTPIN